MVESLKARLLIVSLVTALAVLWLVPNFVSKKSQFWWPSKTRIVYGLDIQGGLHLVLEANIDEVIYERLLRQGQRIKEVLKEDKADIDKTTVSDIPPHYLEIQTKAPKDLIALKKLLKTSEYATRFQVTEGAESSLRLSFYETRLKELGEQTVGQAIEVIRSRIDEFGVTEPNISAQGSNRILVQLPGVEDSARAKELIQRTAKLEFGVVNDDFPPEKLLPLIEEAEKKGEYFLGQKGLSYRDYVARINRDLKSHLPENQRLVFEKAPGTLSLKAGGGIPYVVDKNTGLKGNQLEDASVGFDQDTNQPQVLFRFEPRGRKIFADLTGRIKGKRLAIVLDEILKSAPVVTERIPGNPRIQLGSGDYESLLKEAEMISSTLRSGALPATLRQLEEKVVGPTLGRKSIERGKIAGIVGLILVMAFMLLYYKTLGIVANISLFANMAFLLALLTSLSATLTLPGIAGIILTIGMAVDANVIIFERIKEELAKGASLKLSIKDGFRNAFSAILDANITTAIVCVVLMYFGTGPVRGFAVTLFCGILTSLFTAVFLSRTLLESLILRWGLKQV